MRFGLGEGGGFGQAGFGKHRESIQNKKRKEIIPTIDFLYTFLVIVVVIKLGDFFP